MMIMLHPTYTIRVTIKDEIPAQQTGGSIGSVSGISGFSGPTRRFDLNGVPDTAAAVKAVKAALETAGLKADITLERFEHHA